jgi:hypothetical protein
VKVYAWIEEVETYDYYYSNVCLLSADGWALINFPDELLNWIEWPWDETFMINLTRNHMKDKEEELELEWLNNPYSNEDWIIARCYHKLFEAAGLI